VTIPRSSEARGAPSPAEGAAAHWAFRGAATIVFVVTFATFLPAVRYDFLNWDDGANFLHNPHYRGLAWANLRWMFTTLHLGHYIPVTWLTLGLDYLLWGIDPRGYHLTSILLHAVNSLLFYLLAYRLLELGFASAPALAHPGTDAPGVGDRGADQGLILGAAVAALLFSIHPLRVESVAWITERRDLVAGLFSILTAQAYLKAWSRGTAVRLQSGWYWMSVGLFALALLSKSIVVGLPLVLLVLDFYPLRRKYRFGLFVEKIPFLLASASISAVMLVNGVRHEVLTSLEAAGLLDRLAISAYGLTFYLWKTLHPWPLSPFYEWHYPVRLLTPTYLIPCLMAVAISAALIAGRRRWPGGLAAFAAYLLLLLPVIGILQNGYQIAADRYTYLACLGWTLLAGAGMTWCWRSRGAGAVTPRLARLVVALSVIVIAALAALSSLQIRVWRDSETLWRHAVYVDPRSAFAHYHLAGTLAVFGRRDAARAEYEMAIALLSHVPDANAKAVFYASLGVELQREGDVEGAERSYQAALKYSPSNVLALGRLGEIQALRGNDAAALDAFLRVLRISPGDEAACRNARVLSARSQIAPGELERCPRQRSGRGIAPSPAQLRLVRPVLASRAISRHVPSALAA
jgi:protein O-mannosyl-transferase